MWRDELLLHPLAAHKARACATGDDRAVVGAHVRLRQRALTGDQALLQRGRGGGAGFASPKQASQATDACRSQSPVPTSAIQPFILPVPDPTLISPFGAGHRGFDCRALPKRAFADRPTIELEDPLHDALVRA